LRRQAPYSGYVHLFSDKKTGAIIRISRTSRNTKKCTLVVHDAEGNLLGERPTFLSWEPIFGPDVADVAEWERLATEIIDGTTTNKKQTSKGRAKVR
jgi:hypothetical protein